MKRIAVTKAKLNYKDFVKRQALETDYSSENLIRESCILELDGKPIVIYKKLDEEGLDSKDLQLALKSIKYTKSTRTGGLKTISRIFGYAPRVTLRKDFCSSTSLTQDNPAAHSKICEYGAKVAALYSSTAPDVFKQHKSTTDEKVLKEWRIEDTPFTSGIVNKNNPLKYHFDSGNFKNVYSCMLGFKQNIEGGYLALPEYDCAIEIANNTVLIFDGQQILHGVTPIRKLTADAHRYTIVYYSLRRMWDCLPLTEELARIRNVKTEREYKRAEHKAFENVK